MDSRAVRVVEFNDLFINWRGGSNPDRAHFFISCFFLDSVAVCNTDLSCQTEACLQLG